MGYTNDENVSNRYFKDEYPLMAYVNKVNGMYILFLDEDYEDKMVYDNKEEALIDLKKLKDSLCMSIDKQIEIFNKEIGDYRNRIYVSPKREYNNSRYFYSFNIELDDNLFEDGTFNLDADEVISDIKIYENLKKKLINEYSLDITKIKKIKNGFERYYEFELEKDGNYLITEIHISCTF